MEAVCFGLIMYVIVLYFTSLFTMCVCKTMNKSSVLRRYMVAQVIGIYDSVVLYNMNFLNKKGACSFEHVSLSISGFWEICVGQKMDYS